MADLTYGAGIKILAQAEAIVTLLSRAREALVLADHLEPKIRELGRIKEELSVEVEDLRKEKTAIILELKEEKEKIITERGVELTAMGTQAGEMSEKARQKVQGELDLLNTKVETKSNELETLERTFRERKSALDSEISNMEARLKKAEEKRAEMKAILKEV